MMESKALALGKQVCALAKNSNVHLLSVTLLFNPVQNRQDIPKRPDTLLHSEMAYP
jgi:hypothetical protein